MDFKTAIEHYQNGTATEAEQSLVEEALDTFLLLESLAREEPPAEVPLDVQGYADYRIVRRKLRKRSALQIIASVLITLSLLLGILKISIPAAESLYWNPEDSSFGTEASDLLLVLDTYSNLFCPGIDIRGATSTHTGFASYNLELEYIPMVDYPHSSYGHATLERSVLSVPESFWPTVPDICLHSYEDSYNSWQEMFTEMLSEYPEYIIVNAFVRFSEDISMEEMLSFRWELAKDNPKSILTQIGFCWTAIRCYADTDENRGLPHCGLGTGGYVPSREMNLIYPNFDGTQYPGDMSQGIAVASSTQARIYENQFISQLSFMNDMCRNNRGIGEQDFYENALTYIEENGIRVYGCFVTASPQKLIQLMNMDNVSGIYLQDIWLG